MGVGDYSTTPGSNADISSIDITEGCPSSGINNAIRQLMADVRTEKDLYDARPKSLCEGRLTLTSGTPVTSSGVTGAATLYFTPYNGDTVYLYTGSAWVPYVFSELSIALSGGTASRPHDVFLDYNAGTPQLTLTAWTDDTNRATALTTQDGVYVQTGNTDWRYLGTIYLDGSKQCEDSQFGRYVWNMHNRVPRYMKAIDLTDNWSYSTGTLRQANGSSSNQLNYVSGLDLETVTATAIGISRNSTGGLPGVTAIGFDTTSGNSGLAGTAGSSANTETTIFASFRGPIGAGKHYLAWLEAGPGAGTHTWIGDNGGSFVQSGINGEMMA